MIKISRNVREFAKEQNIESEKALAVEMAEKRKSLSEAKAKFITASPKLMAGIIERGSD